MFQEFPFSGGFVRLTHVAEKDENKILVIEDKPFIVFFIGLQNSLSYRLEDIGEINFNEWGYNCYYSHSVVKEIHLKRKDDYVVLEIQMTPEYLEGIGGGYSFVRNFLDRVRAEKPSRLARVNQIASSAMMGVVKMIVSGNLSKMDEHVTDLLGQGLTRQRLAPVTKVGKMSAADVDKIYEAKRFLIENLQTKHTQEELSAAMKMSVYDINKGFQEIYGMTALELANAERMIRADGLVANRDKKMWEIAVSLGYRSESSFHKAYKKYYGETPSQRLARI
ncbi:MAG: AraC family transcriptional regulator [Puia sp.]|nr:AraC family transcriptional regulator [Puia sp.]